MFEIEKRQEAIRNGTTNQPPEVDAIGLVFLEILGPMIFEPLPWPVIDALRAADRADRRATSATEDVRAEALA
jgi:hypothetical protein